MTAFGVVSVMPPAVLVRFTAVTFPGLPPTSPPTVRLIGWFPAFRVVPAAMVMLPAPAARSAMTAPGAFEMSVMGPSVVATLALTAMLRPASIVKAIPAVVIAIGSVTVMSLLAWSTTFASAALMLVGVMMLVAPTLFAEEVVDAGCCRGRRRRSER